MEKTGKFRISRILPNKKENRNGKTYFNIIGDFMIDEKVFENVFGRIYESVFILADFKAGQTYPATMAGDPPVIVLNLPEARLLNWEDLEKSTDLKKKEESLPF